MSGTFKNIYKAFFIICGLALILISRLTLAQEQAPLPARNETISASSSNRFESPMEAILSPQYDVLHRISDAELNTFVERNVKESFDYIESSQPEKASQRTKRPKKVVTKIVNDPSFNAFVFEKEGTLYCFVNKGFLLEITSADQFVFALEHEITHYLNRDTSEKESENRSWLAKLAYSQQKEYEADRGAIIRMAKRGYNPYEAVELWLNLYQKNSGSKNSFLSMILSTHLAPDIRAQEIEELIKRLRREGEIKLDQRNAGITPLHYEKRQVEQMDPVKENFEKDMVGRKLMLTENGLRGEELKDALRLERLKLVEEYWRNKSAIIESYGFKEWAPKIPIDYLILQMNNIPRTIQNTGVLRQALTVLRNIEHHANREIGNFEAFEKEIIDLWWKIDFAELTKKLSPPENLWDGLDAFIDWLNADERRRRTIEWDNEEFRIKKPLSENKPEIQRKVLESYFKSTGIAWIRIFPESKAKEYAVRYIGDCRSEMELDTFREFLEFSRNSYDMPFEDRIAYFKELIKGRSAGQEAKEAEKTISRYEYYFEDKGYVYEQGDYTNRHKLGNAALARMIEKYAELLSFEDMLKKFQKINYQFKGRYSYEGLDYFTEDASRNILLEKFRKFVQGELRDKGPIEAAEEVRSKANTLWRFLNIVRDSYAQEQALRKIIGRMVSSAINEFDNKLTFEQIFEHLWFGDTYEKLRFALRKTGNLLKAILMTYPRLPGGTKYGSGAEDHLWQFESGKVKEFIIENMDRSRYGEADVLRAITALLDGELLYGRANYASDAFGLIDKVALRIEDASNRAAYIEKMMDILIFDSDFHRLIYKVESSVQREGEHEIKRAELIRNLAAVILNEVSVEKLPAEYRHEALKLRSRCRDNRFYSDRVKTVIYDPIGRTEKQFQRMPYFARDKAAGLSTTAYLLRDRHFEVFKDKFEAEKEKIKRIEDPRRRYERTCEIFHLDRWSMGQSIYERQSDIGYLYDVMSKEIELPRGLLAEFMLNKAGGVKTINILTMEGGIKTEYRYETELKDMERILDFVVRLVRGTQYIPVQMQAISEYVPLVIRSEEPTKGEKSYHVRVLELLNEIAAGINSKQHYDQFIGKYGIIYGIFGLWNYAGLPEDAALSRIHKTLWEKYNRVPGVRQSREPYEAFMEFVRPDLRAIPSSESDRIFKEEILPELRKTQAGRDILENMINMIRPPDQNSKKSRQYVETIVLEPAEYDRIVRENLETRYSGSFSKGRDFITYTYPNPTRRRDKLLLWWGNRFELSRETTFDLYKRTTSEAKSIEAEAMIRIFDNVFRSLSTLERADLMLWINGVEELDLRKGFAVKIQRELNKRDMDGYIPKRTLEHLKISYELMDADGKRLICHKMLGGSQRRTGAGDEVLGTLKDPEAVKRFRQVFTELAQYPEGSDFLVKFIGSYYDAMDNIDRKAFISNTIGDFADNRKRPETLLVDILKSMGIVGAKVAQILGSARGFLPGAYVDALTDFRYKVEAPFKYEVMRWLDGYFGNSNWESVLRIGNMLGAGSVAVVYEGTLLYQDKNGNIRSRVVAIKIKRHAVEARIKYDIALLEDVIRELSKNGFSKYAEALRAGLEETRRMLEQEVAYRKEVKNNLELKKQAESDPRIRMLYVDMETEESIREKTDIDKTTTNEKLKEFFDNVIIQDIATGKPLTELSKSEIREGQDAGKLASAAEKIIEANLREMLVHRKTDADPQSGNFNYDSETEKITRLDSGQMYELTEAQAETIIKFLAALDMRDAKNTALTWIMMTEGSVADKARAMVEIERAMIRGRGSSNVDLYQEIQALTGQNNLYRSKVLYAATKQLTYLYEFSRTIDSYNRTADKKDKIKTVETCLKDIVWQHHKLLYARLFGRGLFLKIADAAKSVYEKLGPADREKPERSLEEVLSEKKNEKESKAPKRQGYDPPSEKPDGLPRAVPKLTKEEQKAGSSGFIAEDSKNEFIERWKRTASEAGLELEVRRREPSGMPHNIEVADHSRTRVEGRKIIVEIYSESEYIFRHESRVIEAACMAPELFEEITKNNVETAQEIINEISKQPSRKALIQLAIINMIELEAVMESLRTGISRAEKNVLLAEKFMRMTINSTIHKYLKAGKVVYTLSRLYELYRTAEGEPITRKISYKDLVNSKIRQRYQNKTLVKALGVEVLRLGPSIMNFLPAVFAADLFIYQIESKGNMTFDMMWHEFRQKLSMPEFWIAYGEFHFAGVAGDILAIDEIAARKLSRIFSTSADSAKLQGLVKMFKPNLMLASTFAAVNLYHNIKDSVDVWDHEGMTGMQKTFKTLEILLTRGWIKVGVDTAAFIAVSAVLTSAATAMGITGGTAGVILSGVIMAASFIAVHFVDKVYQYIKDSYRKVQTERYEKDILQRLRSRKAVDEMSDHVKDCLKKGFCADITGSLAELNQLASMAYGDLTGESPGMGNDREENLLWYLNQWIDLQKLRVEYLARDMMHKSSSLESWMHGKRLKINRKYTGSEGYLAIMQKMVSGKEEITEDDLIGFIGMNRLLNNRMLPLDASKIKTITATDNLDVLVKPLSWEGALDTAMDSYNDLDNKLRKKKGIEDDENSTEDEKILLERIAEGELVELGKADEDYHKRWYFEVRPKVQEDVPIIQDELVVESNILEDFINIAGDREDFILMARQRQEEISNEVMYYQRMLEATTDMANEINHPIERYKYEPHTYLPAGTVKQGSQILYQ